MPSNCVISFDHPNDVYHSGENLTGSVILTTVSSKTVRSVHITINGYAKVKWKELRTALRNGKTETFHVTYSADKQYLNARTYVADGEEPFELAPGTYKHNFFCPLPHKLPTSIVGEHGEIKYEVIVTIDRPDRYNNVFKKAFAVIQELNLNLEDSYRRPKHAKDIKNFSCIDCCFGDAGAVISKLSIPFRGYAPGQKIKFTLLVTNETANDCPASEVKLEQRITFEAREPCVEQKHITRILDTKCFPEVKKNSNEQFEGELLIPAVPSSSLCDEDCIRIKYNVCLIETGSSDNSIRLRVIIGTVPIIESATNPASVIIRQPTGPKTPNEDTDPPPDYRFAAPPSFEDSMAADEKTTQQQMPSTSSVTYGWNTHSN